MWGYFHRMKRYSRPVPMGWLSVHGAEIASHGPPALPTGHDETSRASRTSFRALPRFQRVLEQPPKRTGPYSSGVRSPGVEPTTLSLTGSQGRVSTTRLRWTVFKVISRGPSNMLQAPTRDIFPMLDRLAPCSRGPPPGYGGL